MTCPWNDPSIKYLTQSQRDHCNNQSCTLWSNFYWNESSGCSSAKSYLWVGSIWKIAISMHYCYRFKCYMNTNRNYTKRNCVDIAIRTMFSAWHNSKISDTVLMHWPTYAILDMHIRLEPRHEETCLCHMRTTKEQISLRILAIWPTLLLFAA